MEKHTPEEFRRKHRRKIRTEDGIAVEGEDYTILNLGEGACSVEPIRNGSKAPPAVESRLDLPGAPGFERLAEVYAARNPGSSMVFLPQAGACSTSDGHRVVFIQRGETTGIIETRNGRRIESPLRVGDLLALRPGDDARFESPVDLLAFTIAEPLAPTVPSVVRPDFDPALTDRPGAVSYTHLTLPTKA